MEKEPKYGYMCEIDWTWELGEAKGGTTIYPSIKDLKEEHPVWANCGIVKVRIEFEETIVPSPPGYGFGNKDDE
jgi:hypothetical protein